MRGNAKSAASNAAVMPLMPPPTTSIEWSAGLADGSLLDSQLRWAASAVPTICANPTVSPGADCRRQTRGRNSDKQVGTALVVADSLLLADEIFGNVFQQV
jgi:hypothetical protein